MKKLTTGYLAALVVALSACTAPNSSTLPTIGLDPTQDQSLSADFLLADSGHSLIALQNTERPIGKIGFVSTNV